MQIDEHELILSITFSSHNYSIISGRNLCVSIAAQRNYALALPLYKTHCMSADLIAFVSTSKSLGHFKNITINIYYLCAGCLTVFCLMSSDATVS